MFNNIFYNILTSVLSGTYLTIKPKPKPYNIPTPIGIKLCLNNKSVVIESEIHKYLLGISLAYKNMEQKTY